MSINWELVDERRVAAGLSRPELVARLGRHGFAGPSRLWRDDNHDDVPLRTLERLCEVLDLHPIELFVAPTRNQHRRNMPPTPAAVASDDAVLEAALATVPRRRTRAQLADLLGWTLPRLTTAIATLEHRLDHTGIRVEHDPDSGCILGLRPRDGLLTRQQREALHQPGPTDLGLDEPTARALYEVAVIGRSVSETDTYVDEVAIRTLRQLGLVHRRHNSEAFNPNADVVYSLIIDY
ncbi:MAG: helix-turn-helix domain-containing protein [Pseudonocardia sp.]